MRTIWYIIGPGGCGKSTIASFLSAKLSLPYIEGDDVMFLRWLSLWLH